MAELAEAKEAPEYSEAKLAPNDRVNILDIIRDKQYIGSLFDIQLDGGQIIENAKMINNDGEKCEFEKGSSQIVIHRDKLLIFYPQGSRQNSQKFVVEEITFKSAGGRRRRRKNTRSKRKGKRRRTIGRRKI